MALIKAELHNKRSNGTRQIRLTYYCEDGRYYTEATKEWIKESSWNKIKHRVIPSAKYSGAINDNLDELEKRLYEAIRQIRLISERVTPEAIKAKLKGEKQAFWEFFDWFLLNFPPEVGAGTQKHYRKQKVLLERFEKSFGKLSFQSFSQRFADELTKFMRDENYNDSTIEQTFSKMRALLNYARKYNAIPTVPEFKSPAKAMDTGAVYLNDDEIIRIYERIQQPIKGYNNETDLIIYGKIFVLGTQLGVRVSDLKVDPGNVIEKENKKYLNLSNKKTISQVIIPLTALADQILSEFNYTIPGFSDILMNRYIKIVCELAKIDEVVIYRAVIGGQMKEEKFYKYERITSHTMRRSFATNMFLAGVPVLVIMRITGHKTIESFMRYIRITNQQAAEVMAKHMKM